MASHPPAVTPGIFELAVARSEKSHIHGKLRYGSLVESDLESGVGVFYVDGMVTAVPPIVLGC